jgi:hypothetical protein
MSYQILFDKEKPLLPREITRCIHDFGPRYAETVSTIIRNTKESALDKQLFLRNSAILLSNFKMTRRGPFKGVSFKKGNKCEVIDPHNKLHECWSCAGEDLLTIKSLLNNEQLEPSPRTLLLLDSTLRTEIVSEIWQAFKKLLRITMSKNTYGLVAASKILFSVFPEIVLPVDNAQWLNVFKTVDFGDVIILMAKEIAEWERYTGKQLQNCDYSEITTLPAVYNVMAMKARPGNKKEHKQPPKQVIPTLKRRSFTPDHQFKMDVMIQIQQGVNQKKAMEAVAMKREVKLADSYYRYPGSHIHRWRKQGY